MGCYLDAVCVSDTIIFLPVIELVLDIIEMFGLLSCEVAVRRKGFEVCFGCSVFFEELLVCFVSFELFESFAHGGSDASCDVCIA